MTTDLVAELLATQAAAWREDRDITAELVARLAPDDPQSALLLWLGHALWRTLVPVAPRPGFVAELRQALRARAGGAHDPATGVSASPWLAAAAFGSALSLTSLLLLRHIYRQRRQLEGRAATGLSGS